MNLIHTIKPILKPALVRLGYYTKPSFMIIGAQKAGTSALFQILKQHSMILGADTKELHYFENNKKFQEQKLWKYHQYFPLPFHMPKGGHTFEATPGYLFFPTVAERLFQYNPELKLIIVLRDPTERALSAWRMLWNEQAENPAQFKKAIPDFRTAILEDFQQMAHPTTSGYRQFYIERGLYLQQIERFLKLFSREQLLILEQQELKTKHEETIMTLCRFLEIPAEKLPKQEAHVTKPFAWEDVTDVLERLRAFYRPHNEDLFQFLGKRYNWNDTVS